MSKLRTYIAIILDKSGSMSIVKNETILGFNEQVQSIRKAEKDKENHRSIVSLVTFNDNVDVVFFNQPIDSLKELTADDYNPDGLTAMLDAVGYTIDRLKRETDTEDPNNAYLIIVMSDGMENASREYTRTDIAERIQSLQKTERWTFTYMGANQDLSKIEEELYIPKGNITSFNADAQGTLQGFATMSTATANYIRLRASGRSYVTNFYDKSETK